MEKFSDWRDPGTGISPFMPIIDHNKPNIIVKFTRILIKSLIFVTRIPLFLLFITIYAIIPIPIVRQFTIWYILNFLFSFNALSLNTGSLYDVSVDGIKRSNKKLINANLPQANDVVIVNYTSPLDYLVLFVLNPNSVALALDRNGNLIRYSVWQFFAASLSLPNTATTVNPKPVKLESFKGKTIFIFPEGSPSNGKSILPYIRTKLDLSQYTKPTTTASTAFKFKTLTLKIHPAELTTPVPVSKFSYFFKLFTNWQIKYRLKILLLDEDELQWENIRNKSAETGRLRLVGHDLNLDAKLRFVEAYKNNKRR